MLKLTQLTPDEQQKLLDNSISLIKAEIYQMRKCLETKHKFMDSLKHASNFLNELRTSNLNPKQYYELYILVHDGLSYLSNYLKDNKGSKNNYLIDLYELVQYAGNIIPRLYLMITVGSVYMGLEDAPIDEILNDMLEMCKGVQNPIRGLFLRYYLIQKTKNYLINDTNNENQENLNKIINFIVSNFIEMNKLWVRLQYQGHSSERDKRIEERNELKILVGSNLVILSQLDCINKDFYNTQILPKILEQIIKCKDSIAQNYLLDVIIQIFPDNFQISSLEMFLNSLLMVNDDVNITVLIDSLVERLLHYKKRNNEILNDISFLKYFIEFVKNLNQNNPNFNIKDYCIILNDIIRLSLVFDNNNDDDEILDNLNLIYKTSIEKFTLMKDDKNIDDFKIILKSIENFENINNFFKFNDEHYFELFKLQSLSIKNEICILVINKLIANEIKINDLDQLNKIFKYINESILIKENKKPVSDTKKDLFGEDAEGDNENKESDDVSLELALKYESLNRLFHLIYNKDHEIYYKLLVECENNVNNGDFEKFYPTLISILIKLIRQMGEVDNKKEVVKVFNKISQLINKIKFQLPIKSLMLNLNCAEVSNQFSLSNISYDFFIETFIIYEELIIESKIQFQCLINIINTLYLMDNMILLNMEDFNKLITKAALYGSRLLKKTDQCRAIYSSSHLWWIIKEEEEDDDEDEGADGKNEEVELDEDGEPISKQITLKRDDKRVLECLQKSLRIADSILDSNVSIELFIEILNQSIYYFIHGNEMINIRYLNGLIELISNNFKEIIQTEGKLEGPYKTTWEHYQRTLKYIKEQRAVDGRFHEIVI